MQSLDTRHGSPISLGGTAGVGGSYTALCSRKLNLLSLCNPNQSSGVGSRPDGGM
jgi:hypothetical protein